MTALPERLQDVLAAMREASPQCAAFADRIEAATALQSSGGEVVLPNMKSASDYADGSYGPDDLAAIWNACRFAALRLNANILASPAQPRGDYKPGDRVLWTDSSGMYASAVGVVRERSNPAPVRYWIDFPDGSVASCALAHELTTPPTQQEARAVGGAWTKEAPTESGWYWHDDRDAMRLHYVFTRPGHAYLCTEGEPYGPGQKRNFQAVQKMGGVWSGPVNPPTRAALHPGATK